MSVLVNPVAVDPLIAEAKRRARRRRLIAIGLIALAAAAVAAGVIRGTRSSSAPIGPIELAEQNRVSIDSVGTNGGGVITAFTGPDFGWLTADDGKTWQRLPRHAISSTGGYPLASFVDRRHGWIVTALRPQEREEIARTTDGGRTWAGGTPLPGGSGRWGPALQSGPFFVSSAVGFVEVQPEWKERDVLYATDDGGKTWARRAVLRKDSGPSVFVTARVGFIDSNAGLLMTVDGGRSWKTFSATGADCATFGASAFGRTLIVRCYFSSGFWSGRTSVYLSRDGGATWNVRPVTLRGDVGAVLSPRTWLVAKPSGLFITTTAGKKWKLAHRFDVPRGWRITPSAFTSERDGWAVFRRPDSRLRRLLQAFYRRCRAGGQTAPHCRARQRELRRYNALAPLPGVLMRTTDGGLHWTPAGPPKPRASR